MTIGGNRIPRANAPLEETRFCGERPTGCMGFVAMQRACVLPKHHEGEHRDKWGETFPRATKRPGRTVVGGSYIGNITGRAL